MMSAAIPGERPTDREAGAARSTNSATEAVSLDLLTPGVEARVLSISGMGPVARRLMEMGVVPGAPVRVIKAAPLGDPLEVCVRNYRLALRRSEARTIVVTTGGE